MYHKVHAGSTGSSVSFLLIYHFWCVPLASTDQLAYSNQVFDIHSGRVFFSPGTLYSMLCKQLKVQCTSRFTQHMTVIVPGTHCKEINIKRFIDHSLSMQTVYCLQLSGMYLFRWLTIERSSWNRLQHSKSVSSHGNKTMKSCVAREVLAIHWFFVNCAMVHCHMYLWFWRIFPN